MQSLQIRQILFLVLLLIAFLIIFGILIYSSTVQAGEPESAFSGKKKLLHYKNDEISIELDEVIEADIFVEHGEISIAGEVYGDIIAVESELTLDANAQIYGHVIIYNSEIKSDNTSKIAGDLIELDMDNIEMSGGRNLVGYGFQLNQYQNNAVIEKGETVTGDILILNHELTINGKVDGDVINILGKTIVNPTGAVDGHLINYMGQITSSEEALITGKTLQVQEDDSEFAETDEDYESDERIQRDAENKYLRRTKETNQDIFRFMGDVTIEPDEIIHGGVVTLRGTIEVKGEVDGDVVAVFGNVELDSTAYIDGDVVSVGGKIYREDGAFVDGDLVQTSITGVKVDSDDQHVSVGLGGISEGPKERDDWESRVRKKRRHWAYDFDEESFMIRYNRVEGLFLGLRLPQDKWNYKNNSIFNLYGHIGYGFAGKRACYQIGVERSIFGRYGPEIGIEAHDITATEDIWIMPSFENSLAAFLIKEDFHDFYREEGYSVYSTLYISEYLKMTGAFHDKSHFSLEKNTNWSIFGGDKKFTLNPEIDKIAYRSWIANISLDTRDSYKYPDKGWWLNAMGEFAREDLNNEEVDFDRFILDLRRYQPVAYGENLDFRIRVGSSRGVLPQQYKFDAGGFSALRGYNFKEFENENRMVLGSVEYRIYGNRNPLNSILGMSDFNLILFADAGYLWSVEDSLSAKEGFDDVDWDDLKTSVGFALCNDDGNVRLNFAKRMDDNEKPIVVTFRISRPF
ncbi:hypothetical protein B6I21_04980 [candidate division KSB1 bacterium 4572_119]|nr:MAG: hypothetical protein B6I21_04980 [candidate division KSB1 bacterium 4572_119]